MLRATTLIIALAASSAALAQTDEPRHHVYHHRVREHRHQRVPVHHARSPVHRVVAVPPPIAPLVKPAPPSPPPVGSATGLPLPRFVSLRSDEVNMRSGPGTQYPIEWVYKRRDLPVEVEREFDVWRLVETDDGTKGWVHQATLIGDRTFIVLPAAPAASGGDLATAETMHATAAASAAAVAYLKPGVIGRLLSCAAGSDWCRVEVHAVTGFLLRTAIWGLLPNEVITPH